MQNAAVAVVILLYCNTNQSTYLWTAPPFIKPTDNNLNIYELHFRDFTEEGTYLAAIDKLDYIKGLGINAIHVMPVSEFEGNSSWGYNRNFYFAADKAYGKVNDLKKFIDECHKRQIQVFNDLVLNHAFYSNVMQKCTGMVEQIVLLMIIHGLTPYTKWSQIQVDGGALPGIMRANIPRPI